MFLLTRSCASQSGFQSCISYQRIAESLLNSPNTKLKDSLLKQTLVKIRANNCRQLSSQTNEQRQDNPGSKKSKKPMSSAMKFYLERKRAHDSFIAKERSEFELGKKHLANMMGMNYEAMTQEDVDKAIEYLFPSGLYDEEARPKMKPPEEVLIISFILEKKGFDQNAVSLLICFILIVYVLLDISTSKRSRIQ